MTTVVGRTSAGPFVGDAARHRVRSTQCGSSGLCYRLRGMDASGARDAGAGRRRRLGNLTLGQHRGAALAGPKPGGLDETMVCTGEASESSEPLDSLILRPGDLLDKIDDGSPKLWVRNLMKALVRSSPSDVAR
jgi:hypothetical protein